MRKLLVIVILALILVSSLVGACLASDGVKTIVVNLLLSIFGPIWIFISTGWSNFALTVGGSGAYFLLYTCVMGLFFIGLFVVLSRAKSAGKLSLSKKTAAKAADQTLYQNQLSTPELYTQAPGKAATKEPSKTVETVEEVVAE